LTQTPDRRATRARDVGPFIDLDAPTVASTGIRVAVVHDYLTQRGGAERVVLSLMAAFPGARLVTSVYDPAKTFPEFDQYDVETTWLNKVPVFRADPRRAMPFLPMAFSGVELDDVDVVICSSSGWSHGVRTDAPKIVYCHNPARWLYQRHQYVEEHGPLVRSFVKVLSPYLKWWDQRAATSATTYLANSVAVAGRIHREYGITAEIVPPAITIDRTADQRPIAGLEPGFLLTVSRARGYKNVDVVCEAMADLPDERLVVLGGLPSGSWSPRLTGVSDLTDAELRWLYANCSAVVAASHEDFGLTPVEGYTFGKPAVCLRAGGFLDTMVEGTTGVFFDELTPASVAAGVRSLRAADVTTEDILDHAAGFGFDAFRDRVVAVAEFALLERWLDPLYPEHDHAPAKHDNAGGLRRSLSLVLLTLVLLTFLSGGAAMAGMAAMYPLMSLLAIAAVSAGRLRLSARGTPKRVGQRA
jgi:glycosyltransferase involved in cell wall biosynthesis